MTVDDYIERQVCMGGCEDHTGPVMRVNVSDPKTGHDWGDFAYCREAIEEDKARGLVVIPCL